MRPSLLFFKSRKFFFQTRVAEFHLQKMSEGLLISYLFSLAYLSEVDGSWAESKWEQQYSPC